MRSLNVILHMTFHLESFLAVNTLPRPTGVKLLVVGNVGVYQIFQSWNGGKDSFSKTFDWNKFIDPTTWKNFTD